VPLFAASDVNEGCFSRTVTEHKRLTFADDCSYIFAILCFNTVKFMKSNHFSFQTEHKNRKMLFCVTRETSCDPTPPAQLCGSSCKRPPSVVLLVIFSHGPFINFDVSLMLVCLGTPDLITVLFFSVSWQTIYYENANAISFVSPINLLLLRTPQTNFKPPSMLLIWRWICFYPGQQTQVRNSL